jgi:hypothetical protein
MTLRIPRVVLYVLAAGALIGIGVAAFLILQEPSKDCLTSSGTAVTCDTEDSLSQAEYDQLQREQAATEKAAAAAAECRQQTSGLMTKLQELDSRLSVGLVYQEYSTQVGDARVAYDRTPVRAFSPKCVTKVAVHLEDAMNAYIMADDAWNDCITDFDCDNDSIQPELQAKWSEATSLIDKAKSGLSSISTPSESSFSSSNDDSEPTTTDTSDEATESSSDEGFQPATDDCVSPSTGESVDCGYPGAVDRTVYEEHAD